MQYEVIITKSKLLETSKLITISLVRFFSGAPKPILDTQKIRRSFIRPPNLIHSLDASNIHLLIPKIKGSQSQITCLIQYMNFAAQGKTTAPHRKNNMNKLDFIVKATFIDIYFEDYNFIENLHEQLISQITGRVPTEDIIIKDSGCCRRREKFK